MYCVLYLECPLKEVPLMHITGSDMEADLLLKHLFVFANIIYTMTL